MTATHLWADPPLVPTPDDARLWLRRELLNPEYHDRNVLQRLLARTQDLLNRGLDAAAGAGPLQTLVSMLVLLALVLALVWLLSRARRSSEGRGRREAAVLTSERLSADALRRRAETALAEGRAAQALLDGFRALTLRQIERGRIEDVPGATAREVSLALDAAFPGQRRRVDDSAARFDSVLYGDRPATADQARDVRRLDDELAGHR